MPDLPAIHSGEKEITEITVAKITLAMQPIEVT